MSVTDHTVKHIIFHHWTESQASTVLQKQKFTLTFPPLLQPLRQWLNQIEINNPNIAQRLCDLIPAQCPFARKITLFGHVLLIIPPLCKLNPLYDELMMLRFRAVCYLADGKAQ